MRAVQIETGEETEEARRDAGLCERQRNGPNSRKGHLAATGAGSRFRVMREW